MLHLAHRSAAHGGQTNPSADSSTGRAPNPIDISTPDGTAHHHSAVHTLFGAIGHIHVKLPEPHPVYARREHNYFEAARMSRLIEHL